MHVILTFDQTLLKEGEQQTITLKTGEIYNNMNHRLMMTIERNRGEIRVLEDTFVIHNRDRSIVTVYGPGIYDGKSLKLPYLNQVEGRSHGVEKR